MRQDRRFRRPSLPARDLKQPRAGVILEQLGVANIAAQGVNRAGTAHVHHLPWRRRRWSTNQVQPAPTEIGASQMFDHEFGLSFGSFMVRLRASDIGNWMLMALGGIGLWNH